MENLFIIICAVGTIFVQITLVVYEFHVKISRIWNTFSWYMTLSSTVRGAIVLLPILGITWLSGLLAVNEDTVFFQYIFAASNSLQVSNYQLQLNI